MSKIKVTRAIISVFDKTGIVEFAKELVNNGVEILSTGGSYTTLSEAGINCIKIEDFTGLKEFFGGRVKTLHPLVHGGILSKRDEEAKALNIKSIDLVVVNLYPFEKIVENGEKNIENLIEMIDIGGPTMLRSAAKNNKFTCPIPSAVYYDKIISEIKTGGISTETSFKMALETFKITSYYDSVINNILAQYTDSDKNIMSNEKITIPLRKNLDVRYGENPHQEGAYYSIPDFPENNLSEFFDKGKLNGKELSYNNINDISAVMRILADLDANSCVAVKHCNPCGAAQRTTTFESFKAAYEGDSMSIFGGIIGFKGIVGLDTAELLNGIFLEIIIASDFTPEALDLLTKKKNLRLLSYKKWEDKIFNEDTFEIKKVLGGVLIQEKNQSIPKNETYKVVTKKTPEQSEINDLKFAQTLVKHVKSNAIVIVKDNMLIGVGAGQMNRVTAAKIALDWAKEKAEGAVLGSDAYFPMDDTVKLAASRGIKAIAQPGGSIKDEDSIKACDELGLSMCFTGFRHFYH